MTVIHQIEIDLQIPRIAPTVHVAQLDSNTRVVEAALYSGGIPFVLDSSAEISLACMKPDRTGCWYDRLPDETSAISINGNIVSVTLVPEVLTIAGAVSAALVIRSDLIEQVSTFPFVVYVTPNPAADGVISNSYYKVANLEALNQWIEKVEAAGGKPGPQGPAGEPGKDYVLTDADKKEIAALAMTNEVQYAVEKDIQDRNSVCVIEETGANVYAADNSAYFDKEYIVVQKDTYKVDKDTMLSLQNKKLIGNGSVAWKDWDTIDHRWTDSAFDGEMLSGVLKVRYADDPIYLSMKLPSEGTFISETNHSKASDYIIRPGMRDFNTSGIYETVNNMGAIMPIVEPNSTDSKLPDEIIICIGNMSLYTLSGEPNAKWKLHDRCSNPIGYGMFSLPWSSNDVASAIDSGKVTKCDGYTRFALTKEDFTRHPSVSGSVARCLHFWANHKDLDLSKQEAVITFFEVWTETPEAVGQFYTSSGCDQKSSDGNNITQLFWGRNVLLQTKKTVITGHNISDTLYDELRDTPNDPRMVYADYTTVHSSDYNIKLLQNKMESDFADTRVKMDACFSTLEITEVVNQGVNINPGVYEAGWLDQDGNDYAGYYTQAFRTVGYVRVQPGRTIALYYNKAEWNGNDNGKPFVIVEYDASKTKISERQYFSAYIANGSFKLSESTHFIRIAYNQWADITTSPADIKAAIYYIEDARKEFVEYYADIEAVYGVKGDSIILSSPNGSKFALSILNDGTLKPVLIS